MKESPNKEERSQERLEEEGQIEHNMKYTTKEMIDDLSIGNKYIDWTLTPVVDFPLFKMKDIAAQYKPIEYAKKKRTDEEELHEEEGSES